METEVSNHSKWFRMMRDRGRGIPYADDIRRACFVFRLTYTEAIEFMWSAGQTFDAEDPRDYVIASCLANSIYDKGQVEQKLKKSKAAPLFCLD